MLVRWDKSFAERSALVYIDEEAWDGIVAG